jgi:hypothetical protein
MEKIRSSFFLKFSLASFAFGFATLIAVGAPQKAHGICPDLTKGEKESDCPWADEARTLVEATSQNVNLPNLMKERLPELVAKLQADQKLAGYAGLWGFSRNRDESSPTINTVHPDILNSIYILLGTNPVAPETIVHPAGLIHTYGYLFSLLQTPYGYKRARWVDGQIEQALDLPTRTISPIPDKGSLLANVTYLAAQLTSGKAQKAEDRRTGFMQKIENQKSLVSPALVSFDYSSLSPITVQERVEWKEESGLTRKVVLETVLVPVKKPTLATTHLLVYGVEDSKTGEYRLITLFPVNQGSVDGILKPSTFGDSVPVKVRYNGHVSGWTDAGRVLTGSKVRR